MRLFTSFLLVFLQVIVVAQVQYPAGMINLNAKAGGIIEEIREKSANYDQQCYLLESWAIGNVVFNSGYEFKDKEMKYDLYRNQLEVMSEDSVIKIIPWDNVLAFKLRSGRQGNYRYFCSSKSFKNNASFQRGFYEVLNEGDSINLLRYWETEEILPNYNPSLDIGNKEVVIYKKSFFCFSKDLKLYELSKRKKRFFDSLEENLGLSKKSISQLRKYDRKTDEDLKKIFEVINLEQSGR